MDLERSNLSSTLTETSAKSQKSSVVRVLQLNANQVQIIEDLKKGNQRFLTGNSLQSADSSLKKIKEFAKSGQKPKAVVLCCSDSRAPVEMIFDQDIGDLFVIRVAGNIVAPSLVGSVEFAVNAFGVELVLVMGHTLCGAISAALRHIEDPQVAATENIHDIVSRIKPHIFSIAQLQGLTSDEKMNKAVEANVIASVDHLSRSSRFIEDKVINDQLRIVGAVLDLNSGAVQFI